MFAALVQVNDSKTVAPAPAGVTPFPGELHYAAGFVFETLGL